ncbi:hypothetical protein NWF32_23330 [Pseudomonas qingdaonensis]|nr:hypothetical protein [Pseudomonas qingdaonensis]
MLKLIRRVNGGIHPELEMSAYLTAAGYPNISPLLGWLSRVDATGQPHLLMIAQGYLSNQGDAWDWTQNTLERAIRDEMEPGTQAPQAHADACRSCRPLPRSWASAWARCTRCWPHPPRTRRSSRG